MDQLATPEQQLKEARDRFLLRELELARKDQAIARLEAQLAKTQQDYTHLEDRYRGALRAASESRRELRALHGIADRMREENVTQSQAIASLNQHLEELLSERAAQIDGAESTPFLTDELQQHLEELETILVSTQQSCDAEVARYTDLLKERDSLIRSLQKQLVARDNVICGLTNQLQRWPYRWWSRLANLF